MLQNTIQTNNTKTTTSQKSNIKKANKTTIQKRTWKTKINNKITATPKTGIINKINETH